MHAILFTLYCLLIPDAGLIGAEPSRVARPVAATARVYVFAPKWCSVCKGMAGQCAASERFDFVFIEDEWIFPDWVKPKPSPVLYWRVGEMRFHTVGWESLKKFGEIYDSTVEMESAKRKSR